MSLIDRNSTPQNMACLVPTRHDQALMVSAADDKVLSPDTSMALSIRYGAGLISQDDYQNVIAVARLKGATYVDKLYKSGGVAAFRKSGDFQKVAELVDQRRQEATRQASGDGDYGARMVRDVWNRTYGTPATTTPCQ